jgi:hypothetical protein
MATISSNLLYLNTRRSPPFSQQFQSSTRTKPITVSIIKAQLAPSPKEDIVIVGAGIAGLSTALALHRLEFLQSQYIYIFVCPIFLVFAFSASPTALN